MRLERRRPRLHECEARKGSRDLRPEKFDVAEKRDVAGRDACGPVASALDENREHIVRKNFPAFG